MTQEQEQEWKALIALVIERKKDGWNLTSASTDIFLAVDAELTRLRDDLKTNIEAFNALSDENGTLRSEVERLTKRNELLEEWRKMDESGLAAKVEEMGMRVNKRYDIIAERKRIAEEVKFLLSSPYAGAVVVPTHKTDELVNRIIAGEFAKGEA